MKKLVALFVVVAVVLSVASMAYGRTLEEEKAAVRAYLKVLDAKIIKYRKLGNKKKLAILKKRKAGTLRRWAKLKAKLEAQQAQPKPTPPKPVAPTVKPVKPAMSGLFGWGLNTGYTVGYIAGKSVVTVRGDLILDDALGIGPMLGMSADAVQWKLGLGYGQGNDINENAKKVIPIFVDGILNIPADVMGGIESYVGGGLNYVVYGSEKKAGSYGIQAYYGIKGDIGLGGMSYAEVGYSVIRSGTGQVTTPYSMKGIAINVGTELML